jgi:hypothetical protein
VLTLTSRTKRRLIPAVAILAALLFGAESCDGSSAPSGGQANEDKARTEGYNGLTKTQPAHRMNYSPTREIKNFWVDTWGHKGKVAYIYLRDSQSNVFGYYVTQGLPVSYCTSLVPPVQKYKVDMGEYGGEVLGPGPSVDGTFASASNCSEYYAKDAVTGAYIEYSVGLGINQQISDQPLPQYGDAQPLGPGTIAQAKKKDR